MRRILRNVPRWRCSNFRPLRWWRAGAIGATFVISTSPGAASDEAAAWTPWCGSVSSGLNRGLDLNAGIARAEYRVGLEYRFTPSLSLLGEAAAARFVGERAGRDASATAVTMMPVVRWSFLRHEALRVGFDFGFGGGAFSPAFPPGGTRLNGYSLFGLVAIVHLARGVGVMLDVREMHHSNGGGFVETNPAYDGVSLNVGASFEL